MKSTIETIKDLGINFTFNPIDKNIDDWIEDVVKNHSDKKWFYILHYDLKTTEYLNDIEFVDLKTVILQFDNAKQINKNDRIEIICSPDEDYGDNLVMAWKGKEE